MATKHEFELGDKVVYTHILERVHNRWGGHWEEVELPEPQKGVIVGARSKENSLEHGKFERFKVFMVGQQLFKGAKPVLPVHITKLYTSTIQTHHFNPDEPNVDTIHTFGSNDGGVTWELFKEERLDRGENSFWATTLDHLGGGDIFNLGVPAVAFSEAMLDMLTGDSQEAGDYD